MTGQCSQNQDALRAVIRDILSSSASESDKAKQVQSLMHRGTSEKLPPTEFTVSYSDAKLKILGCAHYHLKAKVQAPCCRAWVACRFCHDDQSTHTMDRFAVTRMKCMVCSHEQPIAQTCCACKTSMGRYFCSTCKLLDDAPDKDIYHCSKCGLCRCGRQSDFYHCDVCDACVLVGARKLHKCKERQMHSDCPICGDSIFESTTEVVQADCSHLMHRACMEQHVEHSYKCPVCCQAMCDTSEMFRQIDRYMTCSTMPGEYSTTMSHIFCNDCKHKSTAAFHFLYHKCRACESYNTNVLSTFDAAAPKAVAETVLT